MSTGGSSADVVSLRTGADDPTYMYDPADSSDDPFDLQSSRPRKIGRYIVLQEIGRGGMGVVCTAFDPKLDRKVAIKLIKKNAEPGTRKAVTGQARLVREAQALAKLNHPNIVTVHDVDTHDGQLYMAMEYVEGVTLAQWLERKQRTWQEIIDAFCEAGRGLAAAHAANITHRDFKPSNVLVSHDGRIKVLDFGLAKSVDHEDSDDAVQALGPDGEALREEDAPMDRDRAPSDVIRRRLASSVDIMDFVGSASELKLTQAGRIVGTPAYMAPEQHVGSGAAKIGAWTDQFSFAVALFESLYGELPFEGERLDEVYWNIREGKILELPRDSHVPAWVYRVVCKALMPAPAHRYPSMNALLVALQDDPRKRRRRAALYAGGGALACLGIFGMYEIVVGNDVEPCRGAEAKLAGVWDGDVEDRVRAALIGTNVAYAADTADRVVAALDGYAGVWAEQRTAVCEATRVHGEQSEALLDVRMSCLDQRAAELTALANVFAEADAGVVERATAAVEGLGAPKECAAAALGGVHALPEDPEERAVVVDVRTRVTEVEALTNTGQHRRAVEVARPMLAAARVTGHDATLATALFHAGAASVDMGRLDEASADLEEAVVVASRAGDHATEARAWTHLVYVAGQLKHQPERARSFALAGKAAVERTDDVTVRMDLAQSIGAFEGQIGNFEVARTAFEEALELARELAEPGRIARALINLGLAEIHLGHAEAAARYLEEALSLAAQRHGPNHPDVAVAALALGDAVVAFDAKRAERLYAQALQIRREAFGPRSEKVGEVMNAIGALRITANPTEARELFEGALAIFKASGNVLNMASIHNNLGSIESTRGRVREAVEHYTEALNLLLGTVGEMHIRVGKTRSRFCAALEAAGELEAAEQQCRRALDVFRASSAPDVDTLAALDLLAAIAVARGKPAVAGKLHEEALRVRSEPRSESASGIAK